MCNSNQKNHIPDPDLTFLGVFPSSFVKKFVYDVDAFDRGKWKNNLSPNVLDATSDTTEKDFENEIKNIILNEQVEYSPVHQRKIRVAIDELEFGASIEEQKDNNSKIDYSQELKILEEMQLEMQLQEYFSRKKN